MLLYRLFSKFYLLCIRSCTRSKLDALAVEVVSPPFCCLKDMPGKYIYPTFQPKRFLFFAKYKIWDEIFFRLKLTRILLHQVRLESLPPRPFVLRKRGNGRIRSKRIRRSGNDSKIDCWGSYGRRSTNSRRGWASKPSFSSLLRGSRTQVLNVSERSL